MSDPCCRSIKPELQGVFHLADSLYMKVKIQDQEFSPSSRRFIYLENSVVYDLVELEKFGLCVI